MKVSRNASLKAYNTFGIDAKASKFISVTSLEELELVLKRNYAGDLFILGGGSNMLLTRDIEATVLHIGIRHKTVVEETAESVLVEAGAGENWHQFVLWTLENNWGGLENLSLIPGNVGTAPVQNIGAYGVELKDRFVSCRVIDIQTLEVLNFTAEECDFGYRESVFKKGLKGKYIITSVIFRLDKVNHELHTGYGSITEALTEMGVTSPTIQDVSKAVIRIRQQKLPDPAVLGNSGSFFKNPVIPFQEYKSLQEEYPEMPHFKISDDLVKVPAGWLIEKTGFKGYRKGDAGVHRHQALVLVNYGNATGEEILQLSSKIRREVRDKFGILLEPEVNII